MIYPNYLYISYYQNSEYWWTDPIRNVSAYPAPECTALELTFAIFRSLAIDYFPVPSSAEENATTDVGYVSLNSCTYIYNIILFIVDNQMKAILVEIVYVMRLIRFARVCVCVCM